MKKYNCYLCGKKASRYMLVKVNKETKKYFISGEVPYFITCDLDYSWLKEKGSLSSIMTYSKRCIKSCGLL